MSLLQNSNAISTGGAYNLESSLRTRSSASAYLSRTFGTATDRKKFTYSVWVKRGSLGSFQFLFNASGEDYFGFTSSDILRVLLNSSTIAFDTTQVFRDTSSWYHLVLQVDSTQATASNRMKLYVNGNQVTAFSTTNYPSLNATFNFNSAVSHKLGSNAGANNYFFDGYMTEVNFVDGQALTPSDFGETDTTTGVWKPKQYTGTYGTNGFYLDMSTSSSTVLDQSSNSNDWTANNMNLTTSSATTYDIMNDVPTLTDEDTANFYTFGGLQYRPYGTLSDGNLNLSTTVANFGTELFGDTPLPTTGKWYLEVTKITAYGAYGITEPTNSVNLRTTANTTDTPGTYGIAIDIDAGKGWIGKSLNNSDIESGLNPDVTFTPGLEFYPVQRDAYSAQSANGCFNFGQRPFAYTPPTGYKKLNTYNLPDSTIVDGSQYMNTVTYTGNDTTNNITGVGFSPDFVWIKNRSATAFHSLVDSVRGFTSGDANVLSTNSTNAESTSDAFDSFDSDGFSLSTNGYGFNQSPYGYVAWNWRGSDSSAVSNTDGTITSTVSANTTSGFSVVTYTGTGANATIGHGLGTSPSVVICKARSQTSDWQMYHAGIGATQLIRLNLNIAAITNAIWQNTNPTSSIFFISSSPSVNASGESNVAYCFAEVEGFSKFDFYTGNGSANGPFVYTGFRPAFVIVKGTNVGASQWNIVDSQRDTSNACSRALFANLTNIEGASDQMDFLSNGFKVRNTFASGNQNGIKYIYMAFAENPFKHSLAR